MSRTIVQEYGPIYGEAVNGTVQGRPNGSVYVPLSNTISFSLVNNNLGQQGGTGDLIIPSLVYYAAESQDLASYVQTQVFDDAACTTPTASFSNRAAGSFNGTAWKVGGTPGTPVVLGQKYYLRLQLINNGVAVATSNVEELVGS